MQRCMLKSKLHGLTVTSANLHYSGSLAIDEDLLEQANITLGEMVHVYNSTNGERFSTYAVPAPRGSREVGILGAAAHKAKEGHHILVLTYAYYDESELADYHPTIVVMGAANEPEYQKETF